MRGSIFFPTPSLFSLCPSFILRHQDWSPELLSHEYCEEVFVTHREFDPQASMPSLVRHGNEPSPSVSTTVSHSQVKPTKYML